MIIVIAADEGITRITVECLLLCELFKIPFIIVLTKCDLL
jgi:selenocysteine-specific translation elongation factor